jgi:membrane-associated phospholipid phosphatase
VGAAVIFFIVAAWVAIEGALPYDRRVLVAVNDVVGTDLDDPARVVARAATAWVLAPVAIVAVVIFATRRNWFAVVLVVGATLVVWALNPLLKVIFGRDRPDVREFVAPVSRYSFPSGHMVAATAVATVAVVLAWPTRWRVLTISLGVVYVLVIAATQLVLGVHFPSDLLGGGTLGLAAVTGLAAAARFVRQTESRDDDTSPA